MSHYAGE